METRSNEKKAYNLKRAEFDTEEQLVKAIVACIRRARRRDYRVEVELDAGVGIADLVLAKRTARTTGALRALSIINPRLAVLLSHDVGSTISTRAALANTLGTSDGGAQRVLAQLASAGLAHGSAKEFAISTVSALPFEKVIAVEAKLSEWKRVLIQAYRNLQFADESWVVLDHAFVRPALAQIDRFKSAGVGLASVDRRQAEFYVHLAAASVGPMSVTKRWQAQAVLAARMVAKRPLSECF